MENQVTETEIAQAPEVSQPMVTSAWATTGALPAKSTKFTLTQANLESLLKGLLIAIVGASLTYTTQYITHTDFGTSTPLVMALWSLVANGVRLYISA